jgi:hypothetical protein
VVAVRVPVEALEREVPVWDPDVGAEVGLVEPVPAAGGWSMRD